MIEWNRYDVSKMISQYLKFMVIDRYMYQALSLLEYFNRYLENCLEYQNIMYEFQDPIIIIDILLEDEQIMETLLQLGKK